MSGLSHTPGKRARVQALQGFESPPLRHPKPTTVGVFGRTCGPDPITCDFVFVRASLTPHAREMCGDGNTQAPEHQPVVISLA